MFIAASILSVLLALVALFAGLPKVTMTGNLPAQLQSHMHLSAGLVRFIGLAEVAAAVGLVAGVLWRPIGIAAAVGFTALLIGAVGFHFKSGDYANPATRANALAPIILAALSIGAAITLTLTLGSGSA